MKLYFFPLSIFLYCIMLSCEQEDKCERSAYLPQINNWSITEMEIPLNVVNKLDKIWDVHFVSAMLGYMSTNNHAVYKTTDGGKKFNAVNLNFPAAFYPRKISFIDEQNGFIELDSSTGSFAYGKIGLFYTDNGGVSWQFRSTNIKGIFKYLKFFTPTQGFAILQPATNQPSKVVSTIDGGLTWDNHSIGQPNRGIVNIVNGQIYVKTQFTKIWKSQDYGNTWILHIELTDNLTQEFHMVDHCGMYFTSANGLFYRDSLGNIDCLNENITHILFFNEDKYGITVQKTWDCNPVQDTIFFPDDSFAEGVSSFASMDNKNAPLRESEPSFKLSAWETQRLDDKSAICWDLNSIYFVKYTK